MSKFSPNHPAPKPIRETWIDTVRATACLMVVLLHVSAFYVTNANVGSSDWTLANAIDSATRACVPLFFMITGYLFLGSRMPRLRHILRVISSIVVYSMIAVVAIWASSGRLPLSGILALPYQPIFYHLWYLYALLGIYLIASVMSLRAPASWSLLGSLLILMFVLNDAGMAPRGSKIALDGNSIVYLLLAISGSVLGTLLPTLGSGHKALLSRSAFLLFWLCSITIGVMTHYSSVIAGTFVNTFYGYTHPLVIGAALSGFTWLHLTSPHKLLAPLLRQISENSLAIYGIHAFILVVARRAADIVDVPAYLEITIVFIFVVATSYLVARALRLIDRRGYFT